jgi:hypothetical protein
MRAANILGNKVINIIEAESLASFTPSEGFLVEDNDTASIGGSYIDGRFYPYRPSNAEQEQNRLKAYQKQSDPVFFLFQRGEATQEEWEAKVAEIKERYPYYYDDEGNLLEAM